MKENVTKSVCVTHVEEVTETNPSVHKCLLQTESRSWADFNLHFNRTNTLLA